MARTRIPRIARARADLGDLRCADNLRCAPPAGPLVDVPFHNELRLFIGEGPLFGDLDFGSSGSRTYSSTGAGTGHSDHPGKFSRTCRCKLAGKPDIATCVTLASDSTDPNPHPAVLTDHGRHEKYGHHKGLSPAAALSMKASMQIAPHPG
jgi:hypothetical protein